METTSRTPALGDVVRVEPSRYGWPNLGHDNRRMFVVAIFPKSNTYDLAWEQDGEVMVNYHAQRLTVMS